MTFKFRASSSTAIFSDVGEIPCEELVAGKRTKDVIPNHRQKKISDKQDEIFLMYIGHLEESHGRILEKISTLDEKIDSILERR